LSAGFAATELTNAAPAPHPQTGPADGRSRNLTQRLRPPAAWGLK
jgi:hypothetical protein